MSTCVRLNVCVCVQFKAAMFNKVEGYAEGDGRALPARRAAQKLGDLDLGGRKVKGGNKSGGGGQSASGGNKAQFGSASITMGDDGELDGGDFDGEEEDDKVDCERALAFAVPIVLALLSASFPCVCAPSPGSLGDILLLRTARGPSSA